MIIHNYLAGVGVIFFKNKFCLIPRDVVSVSTSLGLDVSRPYRDVRCFYKTRGSASTHLRHGGIFSDGVTICLYNFVPDYNGKKF